MKKIYIAILCTSLLVVSAYIGFEKLVYKGGEEYLIKKYPDKTFKLSNLHWTYGWLHGPIDVFIGIDASTENINFALIYNNGEYKDTLTTRITENQIKLNYANEEWFNNVSMHIFTNSDKNKTALEFSSYISFKNNYIESNEHFIESSQEIIKSFFKKNARIGYVTFHYEKAQVKYTLSLNAEDFHLDENSMLNLIDRLED